MNVNLLLYFFSIFLFGFLLHSTSAKDARSNKAEVKNILFLLPLSSKSHANVFEPLIKTMLELGHNVVVVAAHPISSSLLTKHEKNIRVIIPTDFATQMEDTGDPLETRREGFRKILTKIFDKIVLSCRQLYENAEFLELRNIHFDLIFLNGFWNDCVYGFVHELGSPYVIVSTMAMPAHIGVHLGNRLPPSFVPSFNVPYSDRMTFWQRVVNVITLCLTDAYLELLYMDNLQTIYREALGQHVPPPSEIMKNCSGLFSNSHPVLTYPRPIFPNIIEVGGMHCRSPNPLPKDIEDFIADSPFIYFSMGSILKAKSFPDELRKKFIGVFTRLKGIRVLWKWETGVMPDLPDNVKLLKWAPQQDILGQKNVTMFITHGGLLSTIEAAYHGVPLIGLPIFGDQDLNMKQAEQAGNALMLDILTLTEEKLETAIFTILNQKRYFERAKELSRILRDQPQTALERATFWSQYFLRHKGAPHILNAPRNLNFFQYYSIDVLLVLTIMLTITLYSLKLITTFILKKLFQISPRVVPGKVGELKNKNKNK